MCKPVNANLHFSLSPSTSSPDTKQGCFSLGFSSPSDFTRAHREACSEVNKRSSENPFTGSSKVSGSAGVQPSLQPWGQGASVKPRRLADGPTPGDQATSGPGEPECTKKDSVMARGRRSQAAPCEGQRDVPSRGDSLWLNIAASVLMKLVFESGDGPGWPIVGGLLSKQIRDFFTETCAQCERL